MNRPTSSSEFLYYIRVQVYAKRASGKCETAVTRFQESTEEELTELVVTSTQLKVDDSHWGRFKQ